jgi:HrpA-like RNA helicase
MNLGCREDFLMALKDHQVLVLVGETGSGEDFHR